MLPLSLPLILSTFGIIFIAELPDKTALASLVLATKYRAHQVIIGSCLAMLVQTMIAVSAGELLTFLPAAPVRIVSGLGFLFFALLAFRRKEEKQEESEEKEELKHELKKRSAWLASFLVVFAAEWGDLSQLATAGLVARVGHPLSVGIGAVLGLWCVMAIAAIIGSQLNRVLTPKRLNLISGIVFGCIGVIMIYTAL